MNRNIEIKARVADMAALRRKVEALADEGPAVVAQEDFFFHSRRGRLKLRVMDGQEGELIYYERVDTPEPVQSDYLIYRAQDPASLYEILLRAHGLKAKMKKRRTIYRVGQTRVHLDEVDRLGRFVELEVVLRPDQDGAEGILVAREIMKKLGIQDESLVEGAYVDLLLEMAGPGGA